MSKSFLVGNFLRGYSSAFRYGSKQPTTSDTICRDQLDRRFNERALLFDKRSNQYAVNIQLGLAAALVFTLALFNAPLLDDTNLEVAFTQQELVQMEEVVQTLQEVKPPPPPKPPIPIEVPDDEILEDDDLDLDVSLDIDEPLADLPPPPPAFEDEPDEPEIFVIVEQMPELIGGLQQLAKDSSYPILARKAGLEGTVVVQIVVDADGNPKNPEVVKSVAEVLDNAAVDAVMKQKFRPGMQRGQAVPVRMAMPVKFRLRG